MRLLVLVTLLSATIATVAPTPADRLDGDWRGSWIKDGDALPVTVMFVKTGDTYSGAFDSDALQVAGIPLGNVSDSNGRVHFQIAGDQSTTVFDGEFTGDTMSGTFTDGSDKGSFGLVRATLPTPRIRTRDVTFQSKDVALAGTILLPATPGRHAAIVFLHGSGPEGRSANQYLAQKFAERGVVSLIYDKRGVGQSTGDWQKVGFDALADDAVAGVRFLQSQTEVDGTRVGMYGHSQGGTIAPLVGVRARGLHFIIASAAGGIEPADVETYSVENAIGMATLSSAERADAQATSTR